MSIRHLPRLVSYLPSPRRRVLFLLALALVATTSAPLVFADPPPPAPFLVVVHPENRHSHLDRSFVADAFLKKTTRWPDGDVIKPVDLPPRSTTRARFSESVLRRSVASVRSYWQQMIFSGRDVPPAELADEDLVVKYVATHPQAIGYVSATTKLGDARAVPLH